MIIGIDSSAGTSVAVVADDGFVHAEKASTDPRGHAEAVGALIVDVLTDAQRDASAITHVAYGTGPGPFTGLRVGIVAARAFAWARSLPLVPVCSHDAVALSVMMADAPSLDEPRPFAVVTDARRRELAYSVYAGLDDDGLPRRLHGPTLTPAGELDQTLAEIADPPTGITRITATEIPAAALAIVAARALAAGRDVAEPEPLYLRSPDVTESPTQKRVTA